MAEPEPPGYGGESALPRVLQQIADPVGLRTPDRDHHPVSHHQRRN